MSKLVHQLAVLMACHNRRPQTIECLRRLAKAAEHAGLTYRLFLFDDGSSDGTAEAVLEVEPNAVILNGDGGYFWNRSMNQTFAMAMEVGFPSYLWLNDDTMLHEGGLQRMVSTLDQAGGCVLVVGAVSDPSTGRLSYGGSRRIGGPVTRPFLNAWVEPDGAPAEVDVVNGNVLLIPEAVARALGNLDPVFEHGMGDTDYSMRARKLGYRILQTGGFVGICSRNESKDTHLDPTLGLVARMRQVFSRKGLPWRSWWVMCRRHGGVLWPVHFVWAYLRVALGR